MKTYSFTSVMILGLVFSFLFGYIAVSKVMAESGIGKDVFKVIVTLYGITNSTKDILTIVNVGDSTKIKLYDAENPTPEGSDKVSYVITFPNVAVEDGESYKVCTVSVDNFKLNCKNSSNSPLNRPEFADINVSENASKKEK
jgi:hypothetical protein